MATIKFSPRDSVIILDARIKGNLAAIVRVVLDTGASYVVLPWKLTSAIGIKIDPARTIQTTTATTVETVPEVTIPEISVLGNVAKNVKGIVKDLPPGSPVDGLLGLSFLKNFRLTINFLQGQLTLE